MGMWSSLQDEEMKHHSSGEPKRTTGLWQCLCEGTQSPQLSTGWGRSSCPQGMWCSTSWNHGIVLLGKDL